MTRPTHHTAPPTRTPPARTPPTRQHTHHPRLRCAVCGKVAPCYSACRLTRSGLAVAFCRTCVAHVGAARLGQDLDSLLLAPA